MENQKNILTDLKEIISNQMPGISKKIKDEYEKLFKFSPNILICGKSGVGKSTLINSVFRDNIAETGIGEPVSSYIKKYSRDGVPINIYDTPGFETGNSDAIDDVINYMKNLNSDKDPINHIHVIWYCISGPGSRIEQSEIDFIENIKNTSDVPVVLLLTKYDQDEEETDKLNEIIKGKNLSISNILNVSSKKNVNLDNLITITNQLIPEAFRKAFMNAQIVNIKEKEKAAYKYMVGYVSTAAVTGFSPIPFSSWYLIVPVQLTMLVHISLIFGLEMDKAILQSIISGTFATSGATVLGRFLSGLSKFIPGVGTAVGGTIDAAISGSITSAIGTAYIKVLSKIMESSLTGEDISIDEIEKIMKEEYKKEK